MSGYGFAPDLSSLTPGVITDGNYFLPTRRGLRSLPTTLRTGLPQSEQRHVAPFLYRTSRGEIELLFVVIGGNGTTRTIYAAKNNVHVEVTSPSSFVRQFCHFGKVILGATEDGIIVRADDVNDAQFTAVTNSPKVRILFAAGGMLIGANGSLSKDGTTIASGTDYWFASDEHNYSGWVPSTLAAPSTSVAAWGPLNSPAGAVVAGGPLGHRAVLYKRGSIFVGDYTGPVDKWLFPCVSDSVGCVGPDALVIAQDRHWFCSGDNFYMFDGSRPIPIGDDLRDWFAANTFAGEMPNMSGSYDPTHNAIIWTFDSIKMAAGVSGVRSGVAYSIDTGRWGRADYNGSMIKIEPGIKGLELFNPIASGQLELGALIAGNDGYIQVASDGYLAPDGTIPVSGHVSSWIETGDIGDEEETLSMTRARVRFEEKPAACTGTHYFRDEFSTDRHAKSLPINLNKDRLDSAQSAKFHRVRLDMQGQWDMESINLMPPKGKR